MCWGLDTGHNHTFGECWLRRLRDVDANNTFRQRGRYTAQWLSQHRRARPGCKRNEMWACSPTHVPYTSGALGRRTHDDAAVQYVTGGGWGKVVVQPKSAYLEQQARGGGSARDGSGGGVAARASRRLRGGGATARRRNTG